MKKPIDPVVIQKFVAFVKETVVNVVKGMTLSEVTYAELVSLNPLLFQTATNIPLQDKFLVVPKYRVFTENDIGNKFVFLKNLGGQTYFYLYEAADENKAEEYEYNALINGEEVTIKHLRRKE